MTDKLDPDVRDALEVVKGCWSRDEAALKLALAGYETNHFYYGIVMDPRSGLNVLQLDKDGVFPRCPDGKLTWNLLEWKHVGRFLELNS